MKSEYHLGTNKNVTFVLKPAQAWAAEEINVLRLLVGAAEIKLDAEFAPPSGTPVAVTELGEMYLPLEGLVDVEAERARLEKERAKVTDDLEKAQAKLANPSFTDRAPPAVVTEFQQRIADFTAKLAQLDQLLAKL